MKKITSVILLTLASQLLFALPASASYYGGRDSFWGQFIIGIIVLVVIFLLFRQVNCWYWKINEGISLLKDIKNLLEQSNAKSLGITAPTTAKGHKRLRVKSVLENSQAERVGIKAGDLINKYDGTTITTDEELSKAISMAKHQKKTTVKIELVRGEKKGTVDVTLEPLGIHCVDEEY